MGMTMLLTVGAMKFGALVLGVTQDILSTGGTTVMGTVWTKVVCGLAHVAPSWNCWTRVTGSCGNGNGKEYDL